MNRWSPTLAAIATVLLVLAAGCGSNGPPQAGPPDPSTGATATPGGDPASVPPPAAPSSEPTPPATTTPPTPSPTPPSPAEPSPAQPDTLRLGNSGEAVEELQRRLTELGYWIGPADGVFGGLTEQAVFALQGAAGTDRDGIVGPRTAEALAEGVRPSARSDGGRMVELDLDRQLLMLVEDGDVEQILHTSTGTFEHYTRDGERYLADTPRGQWQIGWQVDGWDPGPLGRLYRPKYFHSQGIAVHGFPQVPPYPASHGCARVSLAAMDWLWETDQLPIGTAVWVY